jgi:hypothetical protein
MDHCPECGAEEPYWNAPRAFDRQEALKAEIEQLRQAIADARDSLEQCFEPTVPLRVLPSELERAVKDAYLALRRALSN